MTRHTVMVVGQTGGGKSVILQTLARAQTKMGKRTTMSILNPKVNLALDLTLSPPSQGLSAILLHHAQMRVIRPHSLPDPSDVISCGDGVMLAVCLESRSSYKLAWLEGLTVHNKWLLYD